MQKRFFVRFFTPQTPLENEIMFVYNISTNKSYDEEKTNDRHNEAMEVCQVKKKYYSKNVFKAVLFAVVCFLFIIWGIFIKKITPGLSDIGPFFIIGGAMFEFIALGQTVS